ncbi:SDR family NAD(P)-dependent oxidoreductase [Burkholderia sp. Ac-20349]|uniref:SDR family NAD(P)-dependent oxidoreductase n=1 Tax=Burkholderia sp. Ac-20349 TaxID=2703893 RepID=UPI00197B531C|nr:SDR family NAD(P)-dependent oxidoreductase [Burkholderia sp. Ac-20349]MBN3838774.1 SDR family oxidoreductase [Burkholderia sp. Ac-20349]
MDLNFEKKTVLICGAARGLGAGIVRSFASRGAIVHAADRLEDEMRDLPAHRTTLDLTDKAQVVSWVQAVEEKGPIDVLVYVAGGVMGQSQQPMESVTEQQWDDVVRINLTGAFYASQAVVPGMKRFGRGRIIFITSPAGLRTSLTGIQAYASSKAGEIGLARQLGQELGKFGITVNTVAPGFFRTSPDYERQWNSYSPERQAEVLAMSARNRQGTPEDIANAVLFFASDLADFVTGQTLSVTGSP